LRSLLHLLVLIAAAASAASGAARSARRALRARDGAERAAVVDAVAEAARGSGKETEKVCGMDVPIFGDDYFAKVQKKTNWRG
jgi:hypothetical protein